MVWGILETQQLEHVPGTFLLEDDALGGTSVSSALKRGTGRNAHTILVPQPSNDENEPLRWPIYQRELLLLLLLYCVILCVGAIGPLLSASALVLAKQFGIDFTQVTLLTGYQLVAVGAVGVFISVVSHKYGKRPGFIFSIVCAFVGTLWGGLAKSYGSLVGARVVQGLGVAVWESVIYAVVGDLYYVHERGSRIALLGFCISAIANLPGVLSGLITDKLGWRWMFWMLLIFLGIALVLILLFGWETAFNRADIYNTDTTSATDVNLINIIKGDASHVENSGSEKPSAERELITRKPFIKRLGVFGETYSPDNVFFMILRPFAILVNPAVVWATLLFSINIAWLVVMNFVSSQLFSSPPYLLNPTHIGYMNAGPIIGGTIGAIIAGMISDPIATALAKRNHGVYEPEFRLLLLIPMVICQCVGLFLFGVYTERGASPALICVFWGIAVMGFQFMSTCVGTYMIDGYRTISVEVFIIGMVTKNFTFFGLSYGVNDWVAAWGPKRMFYLVGGVEIALFVGSIPIWIFGKKLRAFFHTKHLSLDSRSRG
ncbi:related to transporter protein HOL1 [Phialocephala subalpina]|uniref:Related to transporter protein HOL1 n=1 Tax=Phialocephala subalpina TaxID=576137 RepID=A0A1L7XKU7_9HELO|nr:related to transporter protein HOL1 [Phialocephala subalpina]